jgi:hypothetical protein
MLTSCFRAPAARRVFGFLRSRRLFTALVCLAGVLVWAAPGCTTPGGASAKADYAEEVTSTTAKLTLIGQCGANVSCRHAWKYITAGGTAADTESTPTGYHIAGSTQRYSMTVSGLVPNTVYTVEPCTQDSGSTAWVCDATDSQVKKFSTTTFDNPLQQGTSPNNVDMRLAAPNVVKDGSTYYTIGSFSDFAADPTNYVIRESTDLVHWTADSISFSNTNSSPVPLCVSPKTSGDCVLDTSVTTSPSNLRVPSWYDDEPTTRGSCNGKPVAFGGAEIAHLGTTWFYMATFSNIAEGSGHCSLDRSAATVVRSIGIAVSTTGPTGPYEWKSAPTDAIAPGSPSGSGFEDHIDPSVFVDGSNQWLLYSTSYVDAPDVMRLKAYPVDTNLDRLSGQSSVILLRTDQPTSAGAPYNFERDGTGVVANTFSYRQEGPGMFKQDGYYFLYYATGSTQYSNQGSYPYVLAMARSQTMPPTDSGSGNLFTRITVGTTVGVKRGNSSTWKAGGHGGVFQDANGAFWFISQASNGAAGAPNKKFAFLQQMFYDSTQHDFRFEGDQIQVTGRGIPAPY